MFGRLSTFLMGMVSGAVVVYGAQNYHLVRANSGFHLVPKNEATFAEAYVDTRTFTPEDWQQHPRLAADIVQAGKQHLLADAAIEHVVQETQETLRELTQQR